MSWSRCVGHLQLFYFPFLYLLIYVGRRTDQNPHRREEEESARDVRPDAVEAGG